MSNVFDVPSFKEFCAAMDSLADAGADPREMLEQGRDFISSLPEEDFKVLADCLGQQ